MTTIEVKSDNRTRRSWLGRFFPSVARLETDLEWMQRESGRLEEETTVLRKRCDELLDRITRLTTGFALSQPMPDILETTEETLRQQKAAKIMNLGEELSNETLQERLKREELGVTTVEGKPNGSGS